MEIKVAEIVDIFIRGKDKFGIFFDILFRNAPGVLKNRVF